MRVGRKRACRTRATRPAGPPVLVHLHTRCSPISAAHTPIQLALEVAPAPAVVKGLLQALHRGLGAVMLPPRDHLPLAQAEQAVPVASTP